MWHGIWVASSSKKAPEDVYPRAPLPRYLMTKFRATSPSVSALLQARNSVLKIGRRPSGIRARVMIRCVGHKRDKGSNGRVFRLF